MADRNRRTRSVIFRLTQEEYSRVKSASLAGSARSLSEFARTNVLRATGDPSLARIESKLNELAQIAQQIVSAVRRFEGS